MSPGVFAVLAAGSAFACVCALPADERDGLPRTGGLVDLAAMARDSPGAARLAAAQEARRSSRAAHDGLPQMIDIVTLGLYAGLSFDASLELYCEKQEGPLAEALDGAMLSWRMGAKTREDALRDAAEELSCPALARFASSVCEALSFGSPLAASLEQQAQVIREEQRSRIEEEIERVPVKMLIPMGTLIVPAMLLAILGPLLSSALAWG